MEPMDERGSVGNIIIPVIGCIIVAGVLFAVISSNSSNDQAYAPIKSEITRLKSNGATPDGDPVCQSVELGGSPHCDVTYSANPSSVLAMSGYGVSSPQSNGTTTYKDSAFSVEVSQSGGSYSASFSSNS